MLADDRTSTAKKFENSRAVIFNALTATISLLHKKNQNGPLLKLKFYQRLQNKSK